MKLLLIRNIGNSGYTSGTLFVDGVFECFTLEDEEREVKIKHQTAIPLGTYSVALSLSQRFGKKLPILLNVPNFTGVRIHAGNVVENTSGCVLVGNSQRQTADGHWLGDSRDAMNALMAKLQAAFDDGEDVKLTIIRKS